MRQMVVARPFAGGYRSDVPDYALNPNECAYAQDLIYPFGIAQQRWGWSYDGTVADIAANLVAVDRSRYPLTERTVTITSASNGRLLYHNASAAGDGMFLNTPGGSAQPRPTTWLPRCMYNGEVLFCAQDGVTPLVRYAGSQMLESQGGLVTGYWKVPAGKSEPTSTPGPGSLPGVSFSASIDKGSFFYSQYASSPASGSYTDYSAYPGISARVLSRNSASSLTLDGIRNASASDSGTTTGANAGTYVYPFGAAWPAVSVWDSGTVTSATASSSDTMLNFSGADIGSAGIISLSGVGPSAPTNLPLPLWDAVLVINPTAGGAHFCGSISYYDASASPQVISASSRVTSTLTNAQYNIVRRLPFKDATVHKNSLWGTGVKQYPNRVYVGPPLWNIGLPPGAVEPFDPTADDQFADVDEFLLQPIDVPSRYDTDPVVALLATPGPLLVLKGASVYGIYGTYPSYEQTLLTNGSGCIDLRSAISVDGIAYWAGREGVFMYAGNQIIPLTRGKIEREWQALMRGYVAGTSYVSTAVVANHLVISAGGLTNTATGEAKIGPDSSNPSERTFIYDLKSQQWTSRMSNAKMRNMSSIRVAGEVNSIFGVSDDRQGRVIDLTPTITGTKCTNRASQTLADADSTDAAGTGPRLQAWSSASLAQASGIEGEARMMDMSIHTNLYDSGTPATASLAISTAHGEALNQDATTVVVHSPVAGDNTDRVDRSKRRINRTGRLHQLRVDLATTSSTTKKTQIPEVTATFRDNRRMT